MGASFILILRLSPRLTQLFSSLPSQRPDALVGQSTEPIPSTLEDLADRSTILLLSSLLGRHAPPQLASVQAERTILDQSQVQQLGQL